MVDFYIRCLLSWERQLLSLTGKKTHHLDVASSSVPLPALLCPCILHHTVPYQAAAKEGLLVCLGCQKKMPQTDWLNQQKLLSYGGRQIRDQGVARQVSFWPPFLACRRLPPFRALTWSLCVPEIQGKTFIKALGHWARLPPSWIHLNLTPKGHIFKYYALGLWLHHMNLEVDTHIHDRVWQHIDNLWNLLVLSCTWSLWST